MNILYSRNLAVIIHYFIDNICPPFLRDNKYFIYPLLWLAFRHEAKRILDFKEKFPFMSDSEYAQRYSALMNTPILTKRKTDINNACLEYILKKADDITGKVLDVGCGDAYLLKEIAQRNHAVQCHGADFIIRQQQSNVIMHEVDITNMPFPDHSFDMVVCSQVLEHLRYPQKALSELIRVTKGCLIIVVPRQREYRYTIDNHVNFFPYMYSFKRFVGIENAVYLNLGGDFLCCVDFPN
ncbi:glycosyl transferase [Fibrobacteria bacterium R8-3-H12]